MHCEHPACVSACPVGALQKTAEGPVVYDARKCIGCRYCMMACPFHVPKLNWDALLPSIQKCNLCADRLAAGLDPACASACPTGALKFGERDALLVEARERIRTSNGQYINHIFGEKELGGTTLLYISPVPFEELGFPTVGTEPVTKLSEQVVSYVPYEIGGLAVVLSGLYWFFQRRERLQKESAAHPEAKEG
jgi:formate dehydrogenase iron-sulfur subunit